MTKCVVLVLHDKNGAFENANVFLTCKFAFDLAPNENGVNDPIASPVAIALALPNDKQGVADEDDKRGNLLCGFELNALVVATALRLPNGNLFLKDEKKIIIGLRCICIGSCLSACTSK